MKDSLRAPGTPAGLGLRLEQAFFATAALTVMASTNDFLSIFAFRNGMYISVIGSLKGLQEQKRATAFSIRPMTDFNEVTLHFIQYVRMHIENTESKVGSPA